MYVEEGTFREIVERLVELHHKGSARFLTRAGGWLQFELNRDDPGAEELQRRADSDETLIDLTDALAAMNAGVPVEGFAEVRADPNRWQDGEVEDAAVARRKFEFVRENFDVADIRRRSWLKATSNTRVLGGFEWDVAVKHGAEAERTDISAAPVSFGTIKLRGESTLAREAVEALTLTVDREDVAYLLDSLTRLRDALHALAETHEPVMHDPEGMT